MLYTRQTHLCHVFSNALEILKRANPGKLTYPPTLYLSGTKSESLSHSWYPCSGQHQGLVSPIQQKKRSSPGIWPEDRLQRALGRAPASTGTGIRSAESPSSKLRNSSSFCIKRLCANFKLAGLNCAKKDFVICIE